MHDENSAASERTKDYDRTKLTSAEKSSGTVRRRAAFSILLVFSLVACVCSLYWWYVWYITARTCVQTYILRQQGSVLLTQGAAKSLQDYFAGLDISSFSALIIAFFFTCLAYTGIKNTWGRRYRDGQSYHDYAYNVVLFPKYFESLCIQLGLLGTLLSFLLAAISQMSISATETRHDPSIAVQQKVADGVQDAISTDEAASNDESPAVRTGELSGQVFLLLCASLVSTFVGTFVAYLVIPPLNLLNDCAVGICQRGPTDEEATTERFLRQLDRTSQRLAEFEAATVALTGAAAGVQRFQTAAAEASEHFQNMMQLLEQATHLFEASNDRSDALSDQLTACEQQNVRVVRQIHHFAGELQKPLEKMFAAADKIQMAARESGRSFTELRGMAKEMREPLSTITQASAVSWRLLTEVRTSLGELSTSEQRQTDAIAGAALSFAEIGTTLVLLLKSIDAFLEQNKRELATELNSQELLASLRGELSEITSQLTELSNAETDANGSRHERDGHGVRTALASPQQKAHSQSRRDMPWWRRWL